MAPEQRTQFARPERSPFEGISWRGVYGRPWKAFFKDLKNEISRSRLSSGAAALTYYLVLSLFPALIVLLSLIPYLPIPELKDQVMTALDQAMPGDAALMVKGTIEQVLTQKQGGLLSIGLLATLWAASNGTAALMEQVNVTYDVRESRPFWKVRGTAILLTLAFGTLIILSFAMIVLGGVIQDWLTRQIGLAGPIATLLGIARWLIIGAALTGAFALAYYFGPDVEQTFRYITPGSVFALVFTVAASLGFRYYVENFGNYNATYGGIGAIIVLMLWLNITSFMVLLGSEINSLLEHYHPEGKEKGEKEVPPQAA